VQSKKVKALSTDHPIFFQKNDKQANFLEMMFYNNLAAVNDTTTAGANANNTTNSTSLTSPTNSSLPGSPANNTSSPCNNRTIANLTASNTIPERRRPVGNATLPPPINSHAAPSNCPCSCSSSHSSSSAKQPPCESPPIVPSPPQKGCEVGNTINPYDIISGKVTPTSVDSDGTEACITDFKATNAVGQVGPLNFAVTRPPYKILSCDQVVIVEGETFADPTDYTKRVKAWFTLSVYMINMFNFDKNGKKDSQQLRNHLLIHQITSVPQPVLGAPGCLEFFDSKNLNRIVSCFDKNTSENIKSVYDDLMKCRLGNDLKKFDINHLTEMIRVSCMGNDLKSNDKQKLMSFLKSNNLMPKTQYQVEQEEKTFMEKLGINPAYGLKVPGSAR
jgi:hypothetical protein